MKAYNAEASRKYYLKNRERILKKRSERYHANPEPVKEQSTKWRKDHRDLVCLRERMYYWDNVEKFRARARESMRRFRARKKDAQRQAI